MFQKMKSKKGFTLAELLIVVAIIAILAAIAVPLFVGAMNDAEKAVGEGNVRAVKGLAVAYILNHADDMGLADANESTVWWAGAQISGNGDVVGNIEVVTNTDFEGKKLNSKYMINTDDTAKSVGEKGSEVGWYKRTASDGSYTVLVKITGVSSITSGTGTGE